MTSIPPRSPNRPERRKHPRLEVDAAAVLIGGTTALRGRIENIGALGAAFITPDLASEIAVGVQVTLVAPDAGEDGASLEIHARVIRADEYLDASAESRAYALKFDRPIVV